MSREFMAALAAAIQKANPDAARTAEASRKWEASATRREDLAVAARLARAAGDPVRQATLAAKGRRMA